MIRYGDLEHVLDNYCELGMYDPKSGTDSEIIVMNLFYSEEEAGRDLKQFIEYMPIDVVDVTIQNNMHEDNYKIFIEIEKTSSLFEKVIRILRDCAGLAEIEEWKVKVYRQEEKTIKVEDLEKLLGDHLPKLTSKDDENDTDR